MEKQFEKFEKAENEIKEILKNKLTSIQYVEKKL